MSVHNFNGLPAGQNHDDDDDDGEDEHEHGGDDAVDINDLLQQHSRTAMASTNRVQNNQQHTPSGNGPTTLLHNHIKTQTGTLRKRQTMSAKMPTTSSSSAGVDANQHFAVDSSSSNISNQSSAINATSSFNHISKLSTARSSNTSVTKAASVQTSTAATCVVKSTSKTRHATPAHSNLPPQQQTTIVNNSKLRHTLTPHHNTHTAGSGATASGAFGKSKLISATDIINQQSALALQLAHSPTGGGVTTNNLPLAITKRHSFQNQSNPSTAAAFPLTSVVSDPSSTSPASPTSVTSVPTPEQHRRPTAQQQRLQLDSSGDNSAILITAMNRQNNISLLPHHLQQQQQHFQAQHQHQQQQQQQLQQHQIHLQNQQLQQQQQIQRNQDQIDQQIQLQQQEMLLASFNDNFQQQQQPQHLFVSPIITPMQYGRNANSGKNSSILRSAITGGTGGDGSYTNMIFSSLPQSSNQQQQQQLTSNAAAAAMQAAAHMVAVSGAARQVVGGMDNSGIHNNNSFRHLLEGSGGVTGFQYNRNAGFPLIGQIYTSSSSGESDVEQQQRLEVQSGDNHQSLNIDWLELAPNLMNVADAAGVSTGSDENQQEQQLTLVGGSGGSDLMSTATAFANTAPYHMETVCYHLPQMFSATQTTASSSTTHSQLLPVVEVIESIPLTSSSNNNSAALDSASLFAAAAAAAAAVASGSGARDQENNSDADFRWRQTPPRVNPELLEQFHMSSTPTNNSGSSNPNSGGNGGGGGVLNNISPAGAGTVMTVNSNGSREDSICSRSTVRSSTATHVTNRSISTAHPELKAHHIAAAARADPVTLKWLLTNYETAEGVSLPRSTLYSHYLIHCRDDNVEPVNAASFGKLIRSVFLGLRTRRLGTRGNSKYHYYGIRIKLSSALIHLPIDYGDMVLGNSNASDKMSSAGSAITSHAATAYGHMGGDGEEDDDASVMAESPSATTTIEEEKLPPPSNRPQSAVQTPNSNKPQSLLPLASSSSSEYAQQQPADTSGSACFGDIDKVLPDVLRDDQNWKLIISTTATTNASIGVAFQNQLEPGSNDNFTLHHVQHFFNLYRAHCEALVGVVRSMKLQHVDTIWFQFWRCAGNSASASQDEPNSNNMDRTIFHQLCNWTPLLNFIQRVDFELYNNLTQYLIPNVIQPIPSHVTQLIRNFSKSLEVWMSNAVNVVGIPQRIRQLKITAVAGFAQILRKYTSLNHLSQAARAILANAGQAQQMLNDMNRIDFGHNMQESISILLPCLSNPLVDAESTRHATDMPAYTMQSLLPLVGRQIVDLLRSRADLEAWIAWLEQVKAKALATQQQRGDATAAGKRVRKLQNFLLHWSFIGSIIIRDLTLRSAASFGSFHLIRLLFDEYIAFAVEKDIADINKHSVVEEMARKIRAMREQQQTSSNQQAISDIATQQSSAAAGSASLKRAWDDQPNDSDESDDDEDDDDDQSEDESEKPQTVRGGGGAVADSNRASTIVGSRGAAVESSSGSDTIIEPKSTSPPFKRPMTLNNNLKFVGSAQPNPNSNIVAAFQESDRQKSGTGGGK